MMNVWYNKHKCIEITSIAFVFINNLILPARFAASRQELRLIIASLFIIIILKVKMSKKSLSGFYNVKNITSAYN